KKIDSLLEEVGAVSGVQTRRAGEIPYRNPPEMKIIRDGKPLNFDKLEKNRKYLWVVDGPGEFKLSPEYPLEADWNPSARPEVRHGDLSAPPGADMEYRTPARLGGEMVWDPDLNCWRAGVRYSMSAPG